MAENVYALVHEGDRVFGISFPDFPGCVSGGDTIDEAIRRGRETLAFHVEGMVEDGDELPVPRSLTELRKDLEFREAADDAVIVSVPVDLPGRAVRVNISIDERLLESVDRAATASGQSRSAFLAAAARARISGG
jgi:predicted RNase H-like HicB family nuclease